MKPNRKQPDDTYKIRCPRLGHQIAFSYCRSENGGLPCFKVLDCWQSHFPVEEVLRREFSPEQWDEIFKRPKTTKLISLVDLIQEARGRNGAGA